MTLDSADEVGTFIAGLSQGQDDSNTNLPPEEVNASLFLTPLDRAQLATTVLLYIKYYDPTSFILDHPIYGILDSSTLEIDGGYLGTLNGFSFPMAFPITFSTLSAGSTLWDTYTS